MHSPAIQKLIDIFSRFPGIGPRTAGRFVFYLLRQPEAENKELCQAISDLQKAVKICSFCQNPFEAVKTETLCEICSNPRRDKSLLCVVEKEADLELLEKTRKYQGLYFILGGLLSPFRKKEAEKSTIDNLLKHLKNPTNFGLAGAGFKEVILAISYTVEGRATSLYLERVLKPLGFKISRLGQGLPVGGEIEYADEETISSALEARKEI